MMLLLGLDSKYHSNIQNPGRMLTFDNTLADVLRDYLENSKGWDQNLDRVIRTEKVTAKNVVCFVACFAPFGDHSICWIVSFTCGATIACVFASGHRMRKFVCAGAPLVA